MMIVKLFLGLKLDPLFEKGLKSIPKELFSFFTQGGDYLEQLSQEGEKYLGKFASSLSSLQELELLEANILSLLTRINFSYKYQKNTLSLIHVTVTSD